ncbi:MAG: OmpA family protein [Loktanella sp.]|nr:OmpA family protein [Loktanella sp.]
MAQPNSPIIIKRKKVIVSGGHHGGAWKVAYADFVTAMMAFFMLMWLLNATTEQQRKGIADYFSPTIPFNRISGGGDGALGGDSIFSREMLAQSGSGGLGERQGSGEVDMTKAAETARLQDIEAALLGLGGESMLDDNVLRHVVTRLTDEGLVIELFDRAEGRLFLDDTAEPSAMTRSIIRTLVKVVADEPNAIAVTGHVRSLPVVRRDREGWTLSTARAASTRELLADAGLPDNRFARQTGKGDRLPVTADATALRNNRIEIILLRAESERR